MTEFTPGPWRVQSSGWSVGGGESGGKIEAETVSFGSYRYDQKGEIILKPGMAKEICAFYTANRNLGKTEGEANARLIASSPCLLAALEELATLGEQGMEPDYTEWVTFHDKIAQIARAAILKARGE